MKSSFTVAAGFCAVFSALVHAQIQDARLVGTWTTKSRQVFTGPGFYDPVDDKFIEPDLTGISYSFTADGWYEEAFYRAVSNPTTPSCVSGVLQWQHGTYTIGSNTSLTLTPIAVDGRQLTSTPCQYENSLYTRYHQPEFMRGYTIETDLFHNVPRLNLQLFDGSIQQPLYQVYTPPQMLPTQTLNPTPTATASHKKKRDPQQIPFQEEIPYDRARIIQTSASWNPDHLWWTGVGLVAIGGALYRFPAYKKG